jgi:hypothetical protein
MTTGDRTLVTFDVHSTFKVISDGQPGEQPSRRTPRAPLEPMADSESII